MTILVRRMALYITGVLVVAILLSGCTLAGANEAPLLTPVGPTATPNLGGGQETTALPEPTEMPQTDVFGTQTAMAPTPEPEPIEEATEEPSEGAIEEPTEETAAEEETTTEPEVTAEPATAGGDCTHTVASGENLYRIALKYGLTTQQLADANGITDPNAIQVGAVLSIPGCSIESAGTEAQGDTTAAGGTTHTVQAGENLYRIALQYGLTWEELASHNGITNPDAIVVGQVLNIPE
ncbi:MAG: LysM peptidoglycan-binding domain-containing protein [Anaerolineae bacterium]|nr:LysM peptidoglycan-binding domain-containing protein [Anaerolineae bacterium]